jgi:hypothetical protein
MRKIDQVTRSDSFGVLGQVDMLVDRLTLWRSSRSMRAKSLQIPSNGGTAHRRQFFRFDERWERLKALGHLCCRYVGVVSPNISSDSLIFFYAFLIYLSRAGCIFRPVHGAFQPSRNLEFAQFSDSPHKCARGKPWFAVFLGCFVQRSLGEFLYKPEKTLLAGAVD